MNPMKLDGDFNSLSLSSMDKDTIETRVAWTVSDLTIER